MHRRDFVKLSGLAGLSLFFPSMLGRERVAHADEVTWGGPYFLHMHASGGWDPTMLCDAKTTAGGATPAYENRLTTAVQDINGIVVPTETAGGKYLLRNQQNVVEDPHHFFTTVGRDVLVINGVDTQTNNHDTGVQGLACGHNDVELPALAALFAGHVALQRAVPMAFLAGGQYNRTGDVVSASRFFGDKIPLIAEPFRINDDRRMLTDTAIQKMAQMRDARLARLAGAATLPRTKRTLGAMSESTKGGASVNLLKAIAEQAPPTFDSFQENIPAEARAFQGAAAGGTYRFFDQSRSLEIALQAFKAGVSASATYARGGFDTHSDHDANQASAMGTFLAQLRFTILRAQQLGIADKLFIMVTSDFGRTPRYNTGNGKDHWNVTSTLLVGPGIRGGRAIGRTDEGHKAFKLLPGNIGQTVGDKDPAGVRIHVGHIHKEMRRVLGIENAPFMNDFQLPAADLAQPLPLLA